MTRSDLRHSGSGPFIVATTRPCPKGHTEPVQTGDGGGMDGGGNYHCPPCETCGDRCEVVVSRRAVATLEEARSYLREHTKAFIYAGDMPESGGTVGPLPDGTVIEVEATTWGRLGVEANEDWWISLAERDDEGNEPARRTILGAFNAKQEVERVG